jgi:hypothetical protein
MARYAVYLHFELLAVMPKRGAQPQKILRFIQSLAENPFIEGDDRVHFSGPVHELVLGHG